MSQKGAKLHWSLNFSIFFHFSLHEKLKFWKFVSKNYFLRKSTLEAFYGKFGKKCRNRDFWRTFLLHRAIGGFDVKRNLNVKLMIFLPYEI